MESIPLAPEMPAFAFPIFADWPVEAIVSTRRGGVSQPPFNTLNFSLARGDAPEAVRTNLTRFVQAVGFRRGDLVIARQVRGDRIRSVTAADRGTRISGTDGLMTSTPDLPLLTLYADCVPIVAYDPVRHVLGVCHAGWQGTTQRIAFQLMHRMARVFGSAPADCLCALGPSIGPASYEVGEPVIGKIRLSQRDPDNLLRSSHRPGHAYLDLWRANRDQLVDAGVNPDNVAISGMDTAQSTDLFFSHRGEAGQCGLFGMLCWLRPR